MNRPFITRFAPSPTGLLHLGHAYAAKVAHDLAVQSGGKMILRIDDIDHTRCRDNFTTEILTDLDWLGLAWHGSPTADTTGRDAPRLSSRTGDTSGYGSCLPMLSQSPGIERAA